MIAALLAAAGALAAATVRGVRRRSGGPPHASVTIDGRMESLPRAAELCDRFARRAGLDDAMRVDLQVVVDELGSNAIRHAFPDGAVRPITFSLSGDAHEATLRVEYEGVAFDPTRATAGLPAPDAPGAGGRGLPMVMRLMDEVRYERDGPLNRIVAVRRRDAPPALDDHGTS